EAVAVHQLGKDLLHPVQKFHRPGDHFLAQFQYPSNGPLGDPVVGELQGGFHHGEHKAFDPVPITVEIFHFHLEQLLVHLVLGLIVPQEFGKTFLGLPKIGLVDPEGVVGIKAYYLYALEIYFHILLALSKSSGVSISMPVTWVSTILIFFPYSKNRMASIFSLASRGSMGNRWKSIRARFRKA